MQLKIDFYTAQQTTMNLNSDSLLVLQNFSTALSDRKVNRNNLGSVKRIN